MNLADKLTNKTSYDQYYGRLKLSFQRPSTKISGLVILTIFTVIFFIGFAILPTFKTIAGLKREINDAETVEAKLQQKIYSLNQAETLFAQVTPDLPRLNQLLPENPEFERLAWQLNWLANQEQITIVSGTIDGPEADFLPTVLTVKGGYLQIRAFVESLNRIDRLIEINELAISGKNVRQSEGQLTANLKIKAYFLAQP